MGLGDSAIINQLPAKIESSKCLLVGLRSWDEGMQERQHKLGIKGVSPAELYENNTYDVVGFTVAELMPGIAIKLKNLLKEIPLLND